MKREKCPIFSEGSSCVY